MSIFDSVPVKSPNRMRNHLTPVNTMSFNFGGIYPIFCKTVLPGDRWSMFCQSYVRTVPLLSPVMHRNDIKLDAFFVPFRLIWKGAPEWHQMLDETLRRPMMYIDSTIDSDHALQYYYQLFGESSLNDYFGFASIPSESLAALSKTVSDRKVCALPWRAYRFIYDYYFRNKSVEMDVQEQLEDNDVDYDFYGNDDLVIDDYVFLSMFPDAEQMYADDSELKVFFRPWRRDIFTSALPDPQNGSDVLIHQADIVPDGNIVLTDSKNGDGDLYVNGSNVSAYSSPVIKRYSTSEVREDVVKQSYKSGLKLDSTGPTMRQLRYAEVLEEFEEAQARGGSNKGFKEWLRNIWGVRSSDARLDRPEYLGGYRGPIQISEVPQTSQGTETSPQGTLAGKGLSVGGNRLFKKMYFEEPGILMVLMSVVPKSAYCQGDPREWLYESPFDFPNPYFDHLGEQEVLSAELNALAPFNSPTPRVFGYNVRNYEMKSYPDEIHGALRSSLAYWHEGRIFNWNNFPGLNTDFLKVHPSDVTRIFPSTETSDKLIGQFYFDIRHKRNLSLYGVPKFGS